jgi:hypothetical protein
MTPPLLWTYHCARADPAALPSIARGPTCPASGRARSAALLIEPGACGLAPQAALCTLLTVTPEAEGARAPFLTAGNLHFHLELCMRPSALHFARRAPRAAPNGRCFRNHPGCWNCSKYEQNLTPNHRYVKYILLHRNHPGSASNHPSLHLVRIQSYARCCRCACTAVVHESSYS